MIFRFTFVYICSGLLVCPILSTRYLYIAMQKHCLFFSRQKYPLGDQSRVESSMQPPHLVTACSSERHQSKIFEFLTPNILIIIHGKSRSYMNSAFPETSREATTGVYEYKEILNTAHSTIDTATTKAATLHIHRTPDFSAPPVNATIPLGVDPLDGGRGIPEVGAAYADAPL